MFVTFPSMFCHCWWGEEGWSACNKICATCPRDSLSRWRWRTREVG